MTNEFIYQGLCVSTSCRYFQARVGKGNSFIEDQQNSIAYLTFQEGTNSGKFSELTGLKLVGPSDTYLTEMGLPKKISPTILSLNGFRLKVLPLDTHIINIVLIADSESRVVQDYTGTTIVVSREDCNNAEFIKFLFFSGNLLYLKPYGPVPKCWEFRNFPKITVKPGETKTLESNSDTLFHLRRRYDDYVIREVDYQDQFILEIRRILQDYGVELVRINKETSLTRTSYVQYQFVQTPIHASHPYRGDLEENILNFKQPVEFTLHTNDMVLYHDFKKKFMNLNLLTNFVEFKATDKYGERWTASVRWGQITDEFNQQYQPDDNANFAYQCQFRCELYYFEVRDDRFKIIEEISQIIQADSNK